MKFRFADHAHGLSGGSGRLRRWLGMGVLLSCALPAIAQPPDGAKMPVPVGPVPAAVVPVAEPLRPVAPVDPMQRLPRTSRLPGEMGPLGSTPRPSDADLEKLKEYIETVYDPAYTLDVIQGRTRLIILKDTPTQTQVADDTHIAFNLLNPRQMTIIGRNPGTTTLNLWFTDPKDKTREKVISYLVRVLPDPEVKERLEQVYKALEKEINRVFPDSYITLTFVGDKLVLGGQAKDIFEATQILRLIRANSPGGGGGFQPGRVPLVNVDVDKRANDPLNPNGVAGLESYFTVGTLQVINLLRVPGEQQITLRVTVAEVNRTAARAIGLNFTLSNNKGQQIFASLTGNVTGGNLPFTLDNGQLPVQLNALRTLNYSRSLAEPNLTTINGHQASFQSGGSFPVPVIGGFGGIGQNGGGGLTGVQFVPYGVQLNFTPTITDRDRIRLTLQANVSTRDVASGANIGGAGVSGLNTRNFNTTVEMREGQTLAVAGLMQNSIGADSSRVPFFGDIPFFNRIFAVDKTSSGEQELVILVTPELVHPLEKKEIAKLPGSDLFEPDDIGFFLLGRLENRRSYDFRASVMNDHHRMRKYKQCEQLYIFGPVGHTDDPNYPIP